MGEKRIHLPSVGVAELVGQGLNLIRRQIVVVPEAPVVGRPARTLKFFQDNDKIYTMTMMTKLVMPAMMMA